MSLLLTKYYWANRIKNEMGRAYGTQGGEERCTHGLGWEIRGKGTTCKTWEWMGGNTEIDLQEIGWCTRTGLI